MAQRRTIVFSGRVQGVGFRITAVHLARDLPLAGTIANLDGGDVELVVTGEPGDIDTLVQRLHEHFGSFIRRVNERSAPLLGKMPPGIQIIH